MVEPLHPLQNRTILVVAREKEFRNYLMDIFNKYNSKLIITDNENDALKALELGLKVDMAFYCVDHDVSESLSFIRKIRANLNQVAAVFVIANNMDEHFEEAYFEGADAIFVRPLSRDEFETGVSVTFVESIDQDLRKHPRERIWQAKVSYKEERSAVDGFVTNFSFGGMFVGTSGSLPARGETVAFTAHAKDAEPVSGKAVVKWARPQLKFGRPTGFGVEFQDMDLESLTHLNRILKMGGFVEISKAS